MGSNEWINEFPNENWYQGSNTIIICVLTDRVKVGWSKYFDADILREAYLYHFEDDGSFKNWGTVPRGMNVM